MPKERSINPALALARKEKKTAVRKHREEKAQRRSQQFARKNPTKLGSEIEELKKLQKSGRLSAHDKTILTKLEEELKNIKQSRGRIIPYVESEVRKQKEREQAEEAPFIPKYPKRSIYYDPVYNPKGVPPPGMPYREWEDESESDSDSSTSKIPLPPGPPPTFDITTGQSMQADPAKSPENDPNEEDHRITTQKPEISREDEFPLQDIRTTPKLDAEPFTNAPVQITYSSAPALRDLQKEATSMVPAAVRRHKSKQQREPQQRIGHELKEISYDKPPTRRINAAPDVGV